jgi:hypothetical protein
MTKVFPDGTVELVMSGNGSPPGATGQHTNKSSIWFRVNGGEWELASPRSMHQNLEALEWSDSVVEFREYLEIV